MRESVPTMIEIQNLTKTYGGFTAVDDVTFAARAGRVTGFLGPNGAGKSTTMRIMVGLTPPSAGTALIDGRPFADLPNPGLDVGVLLDASAQHAGLRPACARQPPMRDNFAASTPVGAYNK